MRKVIIHPGEDLWTYTSDDWESAGEEVKKDDRVLTHDEMRGEIVRIADHLDKPQTRAVLEELLKVLSDDCFIKVGLGTAINLSCLDCDLIERIYDIVIRVDILSRRP